ncbi:sugar ABC transporter permease [Actinotalea sp. M2MS4P-6]|uniref:carbohydrate ABC transporter permease n=1 Tax=Actinotalea sp. M2MS4P-6 TaxID=2983762 RepID=UPI0021E4A1D0|nr:sugar ABC transporter permease [Actinotalea sp. M2MS4P-6]MCV2394751.1 sugar ABC transporter permease [Actinotalea sp. M2MS4P-6]
MTTIPSGVAPSSTLQGGTPRIRPTLQYSARTPWLLLAPFGLLFLAFFAAPLVYAVYQSFTRSVRTGAFATRRTAYAGLANYREVLASPDFHAAVLHVLQYAAVAIPVMLGLSIGVALLIDAALTRWGKAIQFVLFLPYAVPGVIAVVVWGFLYIPQLNPVLERLHGLGLLWDPLASGSLPFSFANINVWMFLGYNVIVMTAALRTVPTEVVEAARMDGASLAVIAWRIKLPLIRQATVLVLIFTLIGAFQLFNEPQILRGVGADVDGAYTPNLLAYTYAFANNDYAMAATVSIILTVATAVASFAVMRLVNRAARA